ncbi:MAG: phosphomethylpyrimidine synthase ThiC [Euryarchaeota archaeon]|nr:phosphomethylpyrimidine synthase ThiC [Euryarchaeota archaeon]
MGIINDAKNGKMTEEMKAVAEEGVTPEFVQMGIASGKIVIPISPYRETWPWDGPGGTCAGRSSSIWPYIRLSPGR